VHKCKTILLTAEDSSISLFYCKTLLSLQIPFNLNRQSCL